MQSLNLGRFGWQLALLLLGARIRAPTHFKVCARTLPRESRENSPGRKSKESCLPESPLSLTSSFGGGGSLKISFVSDQEKALTFPKSKC